MIAGLGAPPSQTSAIVGTSVSVAGTGIATGLLLAGTVTGPIGIAIAGIAAAIGSILSAVGVGTGCGQPCIQATNIVNQIEPILQQNLDAYEKGTISQSQAQAYFNQLWQYVQQSCSVIPGAAGINCVSDRQDGACKWKQTGNPQYPGQPNMGDCFNWFNAYYYPLENPAVNVTSGSLISSGNTTEGSSVGPTYGEMLMAGGLVAVGLMVAR